MNKAKFGHTSTLVRETNSVFVFGGASESNQGGPKPTNQLLQFSLESNQWIEITVDNTLAARNFHSTICYKNKLIIFGGKGNGYYNDMYSYDTIAKNWTKITTQSTQFEPTPRYGHTATLFENKMYVFGGYDNYSFCSNDLHIFDLETNHWLPTQHLKEIPERFHHTAELQEHAGIMRLYIIGGCNNERQSLKSVFRINLNDFDVNKINALPTARFGHVSYILEEKIHIYGGCNFHVDFTGGYIHVDHYKWQDVTNNPFESGSVFASVVALEDKQLFIGGVVKNSPISIPNREQFTDSMTEALGDAIVIILQFLQIKDLGSIIMASKNWDVSHYAKSNVIWERHYRTISQWPRYHIILQEQGQLIEAILTTPRDDKYKQALDKLARLKKEKHTMENMKMINRNQWKRKKFQHYGIPKKPYFFDRLNSVVNHDGTKYLKMVIVGDGAVGKTSMLITHITNKYPEEYVPTVFDNHEIHMLVEGKPVQMEFWDTTSGDDMRLRLLSYPGTELWLPELRSCMPQIPVLLCGTKIDLREDKNVLERLNDKGKQLVTKEEGEYMAEQCGCIGYIENSSLTRQNLKETFDAVLCCGAAYTVDSKQYNNAVGVKEKKKQSCRSQ